MFWGQTILGLFQKGGFAMWPLLFCSIVGVAIMAERAVYYACLKLDYDHFLNELKVILKSGDLRDAALFCRKHANPVPRLAEQYLKNLAVSDTLRNDILKREGSLALEKIEARLRGLAAIAHLAPLLGLLGTVTGLVAAFHQIEVLGGHVQPSDLASGIWEALITTVFGLVIAIPCMAAYHGFESIADRIARRMQFVISELDEFFSKNTRSDFTRDDREQTDASLRTVS